MTETSGPELRLVRRQGPAAHLYGLRIHWEDTDAAGIVYYANYLRFIERARSDMVRRAGIDQTRLLAERGLSFQVRRCRLDYLAPARLDDELEVWTRVRGLGGASLELEQIVRRGKLDLVKAAVQLACVHADGRPRRIPSDLRQSLRTLLETDTEV